MICNILLPDNHVGSRPAFKSAAVDLFSPIKFWGLVNKRQTRNRCGVFFVCTATSAIHL